MCLLHTSRRLLSFHQRLRVILNIGVDSPRLDVCHLASLAERNDHVFPAVSVRLVLRLPRSTGGGGPHPQSIPAPLGQREGGGGRECLSAMKNERAGRVIFLCKAEKNLTHSHLPLSREGLGSPSGLPTLNCRVRK